MTSLFGTTSYSQRYSNRFWLNLSNLQKYFCDRGDGGGGGEEVKIFQLLCVVRIIRSSDTVALALEKLCNPKRQHETLCVCTIINCVNLQCDIAMCWYSTGTRIRYTWETFFIVGYRSLVLNAVEFWRVYKPTNWHSTTTPSRPGHVSQKPASGYSNSVLSSGTLIAPVILLLVARCSLHYVVAAPASNGLGIFLMGTKLRFHNNALDSI